MPSLVLVMLALLLSSQEKQPGECAIKRHGNMLEFKCGDLTLGRYLFDPTQPKPHFHPLYALSGKPLTRAFPMVKDVPGETKDHLHHRGCWIGHQIVLLDTKEEGKKPLNANFWAEAVNPVSQVQGKQICTKVEDPQTSTGRASIVTHNHWQTTTGIKILDEKRTFHLIDQDTAKLIVIDIDLTASYGEITFGDEKDGFLAVRVADIMAEKSNIGGLLENADGKKREGPSENKDRTGCWGLRSLWLDYSGPLDGSTVGIAIFDHPKNPVPACWHARAYGLFSANPFGRKLAKFPDAKDIPDLVKIPKDQHLKFRYALLLHNGTAQEAKIADHYAKFQSLPWE